MTTYLTFDCYDTLVQYSAGKRACISALVARQDQTVDAASVISTQLQVETELHRGPFMPLREVLRNSLSRAFEIHGLAYSDADGAQLECAVRFAVPFVETREVLSALAQDFKLVIISNSEPDIIADNMAAIGVPFHAAITAGQSKHYKPDLAMFNFVLAQLECGADDLVHIAAGFYHDIEPGHAMGWRRIWVNRSGAAGDQRFAPYDEVSDLGGVPELL
jgi:2-haloacid dehalogenase